MKIFCPIFVMLTGLAPAVSFAGCAPAFDFDTNPTLTLTQISKLNASFETMSGSNGTLIVHYFDKEDAPRRRSDGLIAVAIVYADSGGIGDKPVGGLLWAKGSAHRSQSQVPAVEKGAIDYTFVEDEPANGCGNSTFNVLLDKIGNFFAGGRKIGSINE